MKKVILALTLIVGVLLAGVIVKTEDTYSLFKKGAKLTMSFGSDSLVAQSTFKDEWRRSKTFWVIKSSVNQDSLISKPISNRGSFGDIFMTFGLISDSTKTGAPNAINVTFKVGLFYGLGYNGSSQTNATGWVEKNLASQVTGEQAFKISLKDSTWWTDYPVAEYYVKIVENVAQKNRYWWNISQFGTEQ